MTAHRLSPLMAPKSVAILGASPREGALGNTAVRNLSQFGYKGGIYPIHPMATEVHGIPAYSSIADLPERPECAIVCLSADKVLGALEEASEAGVQAAVIFASGFAETGEEGGALQDALQALAARTGLRICGPNCLGLANVTQGISLYSAALSRDMVAGDVAVLSHSGSGCIVLSNIGRFGISSMVSMGNGAVVDVDDYLDYFADDPATRICALFIETIRNPEAFARAVARVKAAGKHVVALKVGRSEKGAKASAAHTGSLSGNGAVYDDFFRACGVVAVEDIDELVESVMLLRSVSPLPRGDGLAVLNVSGGEIALTCDMAQKTGVRLPEVSDATGAKLARALPGFATVSNPLDVTGVAVFDMDMYGACLRAMAEDDGIALVAVSQDCPAGLCDEQAETYRAIAKTVAGIAPGLNKPVVFYSNVAGGIHPHVSEPLDAAGVPVLQGARASLLAIRRLFDLSAQPDRPDRAVSLKADPKWRRRFDAGTPLTERETKQFLSEAGIPVTRERLATTAEEARAAADAIGYPVVLKIESADLPHKSDVGGVLLNLRDAPAVMEGFDRIIENVRQNAPEARRAGVLVQEMVPAGVEVIAGITSEPPFGKAVVFGAGGVLVELVRDSAVALAPLDATRARRLIDETRVVKLLNGFREHPPSDRKALEEVLLRLSEIAMVYGDQIEAVDLNPIIVHRDGQGLCAADALLIPTKR